MSRWWFCASDGQVILIGKDGQPARSKSGHLLGAITNVSAMNGDDKKVLVTTEDRRVPLNISNFSPIDGDLVHNLSSSMSAEEFALHANHALADVISGPLAASTPAKKRGREGRADIPAKRQVVEREDSFDAELKEKCFGEHRVPVNCLRSPPAELLIRPIDKRHTERIKDGLKATKSCHTVLPVLLVGQDFNSSSPESSQYFTLGGNHLTAALKELCDDGAYGSLKSVAVKVFHGLSKTQALRVASLHNVGTHLVQSGSLADTVQLCRKLLYYMNGRDEMLDEPPASNKRWREQCALALGSYDPMLQKGLKGLEPTFQLAQYSVRCYEKLKMLFQKQVEKTGKCPKQTVFLKLQGLSEGSKFQLLSEVVSDSMSLTEMRKEAEKMKKLLCVQKELLSQLDLKTWEEAEKLYPVHTTEAALQPFTGCDFRNGIPRPFVSFLTRAREWRDEREQVSSDQQQLEADDILGNDVSCIAFLENMAQLAQGNIKGFAHIAVIVADMEENSDVFNDICGAMKKFGHVQASLLVKTTADMVSDIRRLLRTEGFQRLTNIYHFKNDVKGGKMSIHMLATWRPDGANIQDSEPSDQLLQTEPMDHMLKIITQDQDWILDLTSNGKAALFAATNRRNAVLIQPSQANRRRVKQKVTTAMQKALDEESCEEYTDIDTATSFEDDME